MKPAHIHGRCRRATASCLLMAAALMTSQSSYAASSTQSLATAEHNTNTVKTLVHHDILTQSVPTQSGQILKIHTVVLGQEDERANRERDVETVTASLSGKNGKSTTRHYRLEMIFANNRTFYRINVALIPGVTKNKWYVQKGMELADPISLVSYKRGRTTVPTCPIAGAKSLGSASGTEHYRATVHATASSCTGLHGTMDLWTSTASTPYVVREGIHGYFTDKKGTHYPYTDKETLGPFNQPLNIQPPITGGSSTT